MAMSTTFPSQKEIGISRTRLVSLDIKKVTENKPKEKRSRDKDGTIR